MCVCVLGCHIYKLVLAKGFCCHGESKTLCSQSIVLATSTAAFLTATAGVVLSLVSFGKKEQFIIELVAFTDYIYINISIYLLFVSQCAMA